MSLMWIAKVQALKSFDSYVVGEYYVVQLTERWAHLIANDYVRLVDRWPHRTTSA